MTKARFQSASASQRRARAKRFLEDPSESKATWVIAENRATARALVREHVSSAGAAFGVESTSLIHLAKRVAQPIMAARGLSIASGAALSALSARVLHQTVELGPLEPLRDSPGLPRALSSLFSELREAHHHHDTDAIPSHLAPLFKTYEEELVRHQLIDRAALFSLASETASGSADVLPPCVFLDVRVQRTCEAEFVRTLVSRAESVLVTHAPDDSPTFLELGLATEDSGPEVSTRLERCRTLLFTTGREASELRDASLDFFSAPGESRECLEVARRVRDLAREGVPFDAVAVVVHAPGRYRPHLSEAFRRAEIPLAFGRGTTGPDPSGRAFLSLLDCAARDLSARAFAEYLSFGVVPETVSGAAPAARDLFVAADEDFYADLEAERPDPMEALKKAVAESPFAHDRALRVPRRFEDFLIDAAVIGSRQRWERRLDGLRRALQLERDGIDAESARAELLSEQMRDLETLRTFALPILDELSALPEGATWADWLEALRSLASRCLHAPERVLQVLATLEPMGAVGPVGLREVRRALLAPLSDLRHPPSIAGGAVRVCDTKEVRGQEFRHVFIVGLAEKIFPTRIQPDPWLDDTARRKVQGLATREDQLHEERSALRFALGAASERAVLSWPRVDLEQSRPRVPSFYVLEVVSAASGKWPDVQVLERYALNAGKARLAWPAPPHKEDAIDAAEYDLAAARGALSSLSSAGAKNSAGALAYALKESPILARSLRRRHRRWDTPKWTNSDGIVAAGDVKTKELLAPHRLSERAYSATGLQRFSACPYQFALQQIFRFSERIVPEAVDRLDPLQRGSLVHSVQFRVLQAIRRDKLWPFDHPQKLEAAYSLLAACVEEASREWADELVPAIPRVWDEGVAAIEKDLRRWLRELGSEWEPTHYELAFGLPMRQGDERDGASQPLPVILDSGIQLRGSIDLVERRASAENQEPTLRATDHKTGRALTVRNLRINGGETLQPALYALALEKLFPHSSVVGGRLHYCTTRGAFRARSVALDDAARSDIDELASTMGAFVEEGFLPALPASAKSCQWCDFRLVCGPDEYERSTTRKTAKLQGLVRLSTIRRKP
ncbi:MAG: PD-(D/E)XK nuclease family protein [Polyangiales bacterium]